MKFKLLFKRGKQDSRNQIEDTLSRHNLPQPDNGSQATSSPKESQTETTNTTTTAWPNLASLSKLLSETLVLAPLVTVVDDLYRFIKLNEGAMTIREEYTVLRVQLEELFGDLRSHLSGITLPIITASMLSLCDTIQLELRQLYTTRDKGILRHLQANQDTDRIMECYRRIQGHLGRLMLNVNLSIWKVVDEQKTEARLNRIKPSMSASYNSAEATLVRRCQCTPNTREQVLLDLIAWKNSQDREKICWISGMAGTGKTTITNTLCSILDGNHELGASFFCTRSLPACRDVRFIFPTIAYQLARFSGPFRSALSRVLERDPDVHTKIIQVQFENLILEPWRSARTSLPVNIVVVIDALDECDDGYGVELVLGILLKHASELSIKFLVSSRPEYHIREKMGISLEKAQITLHELDKKLVKADIETYLRKELAFIPVTRDQLATLVDHAGVLFIYAATVVRYIKAGESLERLDTVLRASSLCPGSSNRTRDIDSLYKTVLGLALENPDLEPTEKTRMELVLHTVICAQEPLTIDALAGLLNLRRIQITAALKPLWSVLHVSESDPTSGVSTLHASFAEYMLDSTRSGSFSCNPEIHHGKLAELCFARIETNKLQFNICDLKSTYVFDEDILGFGDRVTNAVSPDLLYACKYWAVHLDWGGKSMERVERLHRFLSRRLLLCMEVLNLQQQIDKCVGLMMRALSWLKVTFDPDSILGYTLTSHQASGCFKDTEMLARDAQRFVIMFATSPVSRSTPHLYVSMLASWPAHRPIAKCYGQRAIELPNIKGLVTTERQLALLSKIRVDGAVHCVAFSSDGQLFAAGTETNIILVWDSLSCRMTLDPIRGSAAVQCIAISPNGRQICGGLRDGTICIWGSHNGQRLVGPLCLHTSRVMSLDYSFDGLWVASGSRDGTFCIWNSENGHLNNQLLELKDSIHSVAFSPDASIAAIGTIALIFLFDVHNGQQIGKSLEGHAGAIKAIKFFPDGNQLISCSRDGMRIWDIGEQQLIRGPFGEHPLGINSMSLSPDGAYIASGSVDCTVKICDTATLKTRSVFWHANDVKGIMFSPDGSRLISGSRDKSICIWEAHGLDKSLTGSQLDGHSDWVRSVDFSPCGAYIISGSDDSTICRWDAKNGRLIGNSLKGHKGRVFVARVLANDRRIASVSGDREICFWNSQTGDLEDTLGPMSGGVDEDIWDSGYWRAAVSQDGSKIVCGTGRGPLYVRKAAGNVSISTGGGGIVLSVAFAPDGRSFASGHEDGKLIFWDASSGEQLRDPVKCHSKQIDSVGFSSNGLLVASGSSDTTVRLWDTQNRLPKGEPLRGHTATIYSIAFSPDNTQLLSGSEDKSIRVWDINNGYSIAVLGGHIDEVCSVAFSPDGTQIVSGSGDMAIRLWNIPRAKSVDHPPEEPPREDVAASNWTMDEDGWVQDNQHQLLLWVPPDLRSILLWPENTILISRQGCIELDFSRARIGSDWTTGYQPL